MVDRARAPKRTTPRAPRPQPGRHALTNVVVEVVEDLDVANGWMLVIDGVPNSYLDLDDPGHLLFEYLQWLSYAVELVPGERPAVVHLGGGAYTFPRYLSATRPGVRQLVVEYDPELIALIRKLFGPPGRGWRIKAGDARDVLATRRDGSADVIVRDAFIGALVPPHLTTVEFIEDAARVLGKDGMYLANVTDGLALQFARAEVATAMAVFDHVALMGETPVLKGRRYGNLGLIASPQPVEVTDLARRLARCVAPTRVLSGPELQRFVGGAAPLRDADDLYLPEPPPRFL